MDMSFNTKIMAATILLQVLAMQCAVAAPDAAFTQFIASLWPEAQAAGVSRATFDAETSGLEPDYKLPDLILPGRPATGAPSQAEFVQVPADYIKEASIARLAEAARVRDDLPKPGGYYDALGPHSTRLEIWHTIYNHVLADAPAIVEWVKGTGLRPFVEPLEPPERKQYLAEYTARIAAAYPPQADGKVLLRFPRLFIVAVR